MTKKFTKVITKREAQFDFPKRCKNSKNFPTNPKNGGKPAMLRKQVIINIVVAGALPNTLNSFRVFTYRKSNKKNIENMLVATITYIKTFTIKTLNPPSKTE